MVALPSVMVKAVFLSEVAPEWWLIAERTVALCGRSEVLLRGTGTDGEETRCLPARISPTWRCIVCNDTKPHDRVRRKQHTSTRHAKACHPTVWSCISTLARHGRDNSLAEQGGDARTRIGDVYNLEKA